MASEGIPLRHAVSRMRQQIAGDALEALSQLLPHHAQFFWLFTRRLPLNPSTGTHLEDLLQVLVSSLAAIREFLGRLEVADGEDERLQS